MSHANIKKLLLPLAPMLICLAIWFLPFTNSFCKQVDASVFSYLNKTLLWSHAWLQFCGWLNHPNESWLNVIVMFGINLISIVLLKKQRLENLKLVIFYWLFFQIGLLLSHFIFSDLLSIKRESPSLIIDPLVKLSNALGMPVKDYSASSFPAGHAFVLIYWLRFTSLYAPASMKFLAWIVVLVLTPARLFSGAHWLSDIIFTITMAYVWFCWSKLFYASRTLNLVKNFLSENVYQKLSLLTRKHKVSNFNHNNHSNHSTTDCFAGKHNTKNKLSKLK